MHSVKYLFLKTSLNLVMAITIGLSFMMQSNLVQAQEKMPLIEETMYVKSGATVMWQSQQKASRYLWQQAAGLPVRIEQPKKNNLIFNAPKVAEQTTLIFELKTTEAGAWKLPHVTTILTVEVKP